MLPENPTFMIRGEDGKEYGPVGLEELREWVAENRAGIGTEVKRDEPGATWQPWQSQPELVALLAAVHATAEGPAAAIAPVWRRVAAFMVDYFLASLLATPPVYVIESIAHMPDLMLRFLMAVLQPDMPGAADVFFYANLCNSVGLVTLILYFAGFHAAHGQTPGKQLLRVRVVTATGERPHIVQAVWRSAVMVMTMYFLLFIPILYVFFNSQRRTLHDLFAGTYVVEA